MKIVVLESAVMTPGGISLDVYKQFGEVTVYPQTEQKDVISRIGDADAILVNKLIINGEVMSACKNLKYVGLFATGYNNIDVKYAKEHGVTVCNAGHYSTDAVAQHTFALILNHYNRIYDYHMIVQNGAWEKSRLFTLYDFPTDELYSKTIGIVGYGNIGKRVCEIALAFGMKVLVHTRTPKDDSRVEFVSLDTLLKQSDIISLHCPLTEDNRLMMNEEAFKKCEKKPLFVNTARGGLVDESALKNAVLSGLLSGAALDTIATEPMKNCVLKGVPNITITPHSAWASFTTRKRLLNITVKCIRGWLEGNPVNVVSK